MEVDGVGRAHFDVVFPRHVSVWMSASAIGSDGLPLSRTSRVIKGRPLAILHLDRFEGGHEDR